MTFQKALAELKAGKWITRPALGYLTIIAHRASLPASWVEKADWASDEYFEVVLYEFALNEGDLLFEAIGPPEFSQAEQTADDWEVFDLPRQEDHPGWRRPILPWEKV